MSGVSAVMNNLLARLPGRKAAQMQAEAVPVRDWITVRSGEPARLLGFDQTLVGVVIALLSLGIVRSTAPRSRCPTTRRWPATARAITSRASCPPL